MASVEDLGEIQFYSKGRQLRSKNKAKRKTHLESLEDQPKRVGLIYDERMLAHECLWDTNFPEKPERARCIWERCKEYGLVERCTRLPARMCLGEELLSVHTDDYIFKLQATSDYNRIELKALSSCYDAVYFNQNSYEAVRLAAGSSIDLVDAIMQSRVRNGFAIIRPPGHHAMADAGCGYCLVNNVAVAAKHALSRLGLERILIVDIDVHHGQATQFTFYEDPRVLYFSIHRYEYGTFWPNLRESDYDFIGQGKGKGFNINVPFNEVGMTDADYISIFQQILLPVANEFHPELVIVSCGYDAALGDPEGASELTPACYPHLLHMLQPLAQGRMAVILEGGYCMQAVAEAGALTLRELLGDPTPNLQPLKEPLEKTRESILQVIRVLRPFWHCFAYQGTAKTFDQLALILKDIKVPKDRNEFYYSVGPRVLAEQRQLLEFVTFNTKLLLPAHRTCLAYDTRMNAHDHPQKSHIERPSRIECSHERLKDYGLLQRMHLVKCREATVEEIRSVHTKTYVREAQGWEKRTESDLYELSTLYNSVYVVKDSYKAALLCAGGVLSTVDCVLRNEASNGFALVRPPGHHAEDNRCMGFCIFNQVAVAVRYAQQTYGLKRILIVDWDVHHGNGTQSMFYEDDSVLFISLHRFDKGSFYPGHASANYFFVGKGDGTGFNVNVSWCGKGRPMGDAEYIAAFQQVVMPIAYEFNPELVLVSAGFDAAAGDPLGGYKVTPEGYAHMTHMLTSLAMGRVILVLEGGYQLETVSECVCACVSVLLGDHCPPLPQNLVPARCAVDTIKLVLKAHSKYWNMLKYQEKLPSRDLTTLWLREQHNKTKGTYKVDGVRPGSITSKLTELQISTQDQPDSAMEGVVCDTPSPCSSSGSPTDKFAPDGIFSQASANEQNAKPTNDAITEQPANQDAVTEQPANQDAVTEQPANHDAITQVEAEHLSPTLVKQEELMSDPQVMPLVIQAFDARSQDKPAAKSFPDMFSPDHCEGKVTSVTSPNCVVASSPGPHDADHNPPQGGGGGEPAGGPGGRGDEDGAGGGQDQEEHVMEFLGVDAPALGGALQMFSVHPLPWCPHLPFVAPVPEDGLRVADPCLECNHIGENWVCLVCYEVHCSRYINEHMLIHGATMEHPLVMSYADLSVWCYACESYIHNEILLPAKRAAHRNKFGEDIPGYQ